MIEFEKPKIECLKLDNDNMYAKFVCEPGEFNIYVGTNCYADMSISIKVTE